MLSSSGQTCLYWEHRYSPSNQEQWKRIKIEFLIKNRSKGQWSVWAVSITSGSVRWEWQERETSTATGHPVDRECSLLNGCLAFGNDNPVRYSSLYFLFIHSVSLSYLYEYTNEPPLSTHRERIPLRTSISICIELYLFILKDTDAYTDVFTYIMIFL